MSLYAVLDDIELEIIAWLDGLEMRFAADYATQGLIGRKSLIQHTGYQPDEVTIDALLHASWCNPADEVARLKAAMDEARPLAFVLGTGEYRGVFVIERLEVTTRQTDGYGAVISFECRISLKEYIGDPAEPLPPGVIREGYRIPIAAEGSADWDVGDMAMRWPGDGGGSILSDITDAVCGAVSAIGRVTQAATSVATLARIASADPSAALLALPGVSAGVAQAASSLPVDAMQGLQQFAAIAADAGQVAGAMQSARAMLDGAYGALDAGLSGISVALWNVNAAATTLDGARDALSRIGQAAILKEPQLWHI
ncbi:phage tail protein [Thiofaba sp. EF100]|uniref:phage tail protein n=1 Tax=Thiofaba sp. EF100 TaxID=3121274 RepID=UPI003221916F